MHTYMLTYIVDTNYTINAVCKLWREMGLIPDVMGHIASFLKGIKGFMNLYGNYNHLFHRIYWEKHILFLEVISKKKITIYKVYNNQTLVSSIDNVRI